jgi:hypothetical protein
MKKPKETKLPADDSQLHPVVRLAMMGGPMTGDESDFWPTGLSREEETGDSGSGLSQAQEPIQEAPAEVPPADSIPSYSQPDSIWERAAQNVLANGLASSIEEARKMVDEAF